MGNQHHKRWMQGFLAFGLLWVIFSLASIIRGEGSEPRQTGDPTAVETATPTLTVTGTLEPTPTLPAIPTLTVTPTLEPTPTLTATLLRQNYLPAIMNDPSPTPSPTPTETPVPGCVSPPEIPSSNLSNEAAIRHGINQQRANNGATTLALAGELTQSSRRHSLDMAQNHFTGHIGSDGTTAGDRMRAACYDWNYWGEIIGWGFGGDTNAMLNWWMNSPPHRALILNSFVEEFGAGYIRRSGSEWTHYWTVNFGRRAASQSAIAVPLYFCEYHAESAVGGSSLRVYSPEPCLGE
jgi:uncharacterized protein YkwD